MFSSFEEDTGREERPFVPTPQPAPRVWPCPKDLNPLLELVKDSNHPVLIGGHGVW